MSVADEWLVSGRRRTIAGRSLLPVRHPVGDRALSVIRSQAETFVLEDDRGDRWILKKFLPAREPDPVYVRAVRDSIPLHEAFRAAHERTVIARGDVPTAGSDRAFAEWAVGTVLMPNVAGLPWGHLMNGIVESDPDLPVEDRVTLAARLAGLCAILEAAEVAHRDLSPGNVLVDLDRLAPILIDWDSAYLPSLPFQEKTTIGSPGYIAPWAADDASRSWHPTGDRHALIQMTAELIAIAPGDPVAGDGSWFRQEEVGVPGPRLDLLMERLRVRLPSLVPIVTDNLLARSGADTPGPQDVLEALASEVPAVRPIADEVVDGVRRAERLRRGTLTADLTVLPPDVHPYLARRELERKAEVPSLDAIPVANPVVPGGSVVRTDPLPSPRDAHRGSRWTKVAGAVSLLGIAAGVYLFAGLGGSPAPAPASAGATLSPRAGTPIPTISAKALGEIASSCRRVAGGPGASGVPVGVERAVVCPIGDGAAVEVTLLGFDNSISMYRWIQSIATGRSMPQDRPVYGCAAGVTGSERWRHGQIVCGNDAMPDGVSASIAWTDLRSRMGGILVTEQPQIEVAHGIWRQLIDAGDAILTTASVEDPSPRPPDENGGTGGEAGQITDDALRLLLASCRAGRTIPGVTDQPTGIASIVTCKGPPAGPEALTLIRFRDSSSLARWIDPFIEMTASPWAGTDPTCPQGFQGGGSWEGGQLVCSSVPSGERQRVTKIFWSDAEAKVGGILIASPWGLETTYRWWTELIAADVVNVHAARPTPASTRRPAPTTTADRTKPPEPEPTDTPAGLTEPERRLAAVLDSDLAASCTGWAADRAAVPMPGGATAAIICRDRGTGGEELTLARFTARDDLDRWLAGLVGDRPRRGTPDGGCRLGREGSEPWEDGRVLCRRTTAGLRDAVRIDWTNRRRLILGTLVLTAPGVSIEDAYRRWLGLATASDPAADPTRQTSGPAEGEERASPSPSADGEPPATPRPTLGLTSIVDPGVAIDCRADPVAGDPAVALTGSAIAVFCPIPGVPGAEVRLLRIRDGPDALAKLEAILDPRQRRDRPEPDCRSDRTAAGSWAGGVVRCGASLFDDVTAVTIDWTDRATSTYGRITWPSGPTAVGDAYSWWLAEVAIVTPRGQVGGPADPATDGEWSERMRSTVATTTALIAAAEDVTDPERSATVIREAARAVRDSIEWTDRRSPDPCAAARWEEWRGHLIGIEEGLLIQAGARQAGRLPITVDGQTPLEWIRSRLEQISVIESELPNEPCP